ncbi:hypothetical protein [Neomoorella humiferrea]|uniref:hypothetical protein n=1 Tax=Neomoorella humiferrea TaxID=676965 RepID=UPI0030CBD2B1
MAPEGRKIKANYFPVWAHYINEIQMNMLPEYVEKGMLKAMVVFGGNAMMWPQTTQYQQAIARMEFSVAADYYLRPWTHNFMDMVFPAAMTYERMAPPLCLLFFYRHLTNFSAIYLKAAGKNRKAGNLYITCLFLEEVISNVTLAVTAEASGGGCPAGSGFPG